MYTKHLIDKVLVMLEMGDKTALFVLLTKDGTIHRKGYGSKADDALPVLEGISRVKHFEAMMMTVDENIFQMAGVYRSKTVIGTECKLTIVFNGEGVDYGFRWVYGEESEGPPHELTDIVINAVKITDSWYGEMQQKNQEEGKKEWWQVWK
jgi:hypothetical protein